LAALRERPGQTREELGMTTELSGASVAQNLRRLIEQGQIEQRALPDGGTVFALATNGS
jgi:DNA-binding MarR family transcriptional regulator